jgi:hypothetical protein
VNTHYRHTSAFRRRSIATTLPRSTRSALTGPLTAALLAAVLALLWCSIARSAPLPTNDAARQLGLQRLALQRVALPSAPRNATVTLEIDGRRVAVRFERVSLRAPGFKVLVQDQHGALREAEAPPSETYRGESADLPGARIGGSIHRGGLSAALALADGRLFYVQPLHEVVAGADPALHVVYRADEATVEGEGVCTVHEAQAVVPPRSLSPGATPLGAIEIADLAYDADYELYVRNGNSVDSTVNDVERVTAAVNVVFERDCNLSHRIVTIVVRSTEPDPYTSTDPDIMLDQLTDYWNGPNAGVPRDMVHLMTGKDVDGGTIGYAAVGAVCNRSRAYGLSQTKFTSNFSRRTALTAHELGHNWNAVHCDGVTPCNIMCSSINGCNGIGLPNFEPQGANDIMDFAATRSCLDSPPMAVGTPALGGAVRFGPPRPSPFTRETQLAYFVDQPGPVRLGVYDVSGNRVARLIDRFESAGWHSLAWSAVDRSGRPLSPGVYYARLESRGETRTQKLVLVK